MGAHSLLPGNPDLQCLDGVYGGDGKRQWRYKRNVIGACKGFKRAGVGTNRILECNLVSKTRTGPDGHHSKCPLPMVVLTGLLKELFVCQPTL
jgi:hypothetical protein